MAAISWKSGVSGDWSNSSDWSTGTVPGGTDSVTISASGTYTVTISSAEAAQSVDLAASGATLQINASFNVSGGFTAQNSVIAIASGQTLTLPGAVSFGVNGNYGPSLERARHAGHQRYNGPRRANRRQLSGPLHWRRGNLVPP